jgi:CRISPR-associated protein Cmr2
MPQTYIALTIGPIYKTFLQVRKTRELWAASYLFSMLSQEILICIKGKEISMPYTGKVKLKDKEEFDIMENNSGVGLFPDRIIYKGDAVDFDALNNEHIPAAINAISKAIGIAPALLKRYLRIQCIIKALEDEANPIISLTPYLDALELQDKALSTEADEKELLDFFRGVNTSTFFKGLFAEQDGKAKPGCMIQDINRQARFESLVEISTRGLQSIGNSTYTDLMNELIWKEAEPGEMDGDEAFLTALKQHCADEVKNTTNKTAFKAYHKYICIVKADGDKIGKTLESLNNSQLETFSKSLLRWGLLAKQEISDYKGVPVYIGGDDLLFFAPVSTGKQTIIDLVNKIDACLEKVFDGFDTKPTLSYGISISYYKYPLYEAVQAVEELLYKAKEVPGKNAIALRILKHSGKTLNWACSKGNDIYTAHFSSLMHQPEKDGGFINSAMFRIRDNEPLFNIIGKDKERVKHFFDNNFNEDVHDPKRTYLDKVAKLLPTLVTQAVETQTAAKETTLTIDEKKEAIHTGISEVYALLKTTNFLNGTDDEH